MKQILMNSDNQLVIAVRSPLLAWTGGLGIIFLLGLGYLLITPGHSGDERIIGLIGATATCAVAFFVFYEKSFFSFDLQAQTLTWAKQRGFSKHRGIIPFSSIQRIVLQSCIGNDKYYPKHRVVLITQDGELPLIGAYEHDDMNEIIAERIRSALATSRTTLLEDSIRSLVESGRDVDAIRLLREKSGVTLSEAHTVISRMRIEHKTMANSK